MKPPAVNRGWGDDSDEEDVVMANVRETERLQAEMAREKNVLKVRQGCVRFERCCIGRSVYVFM